MEPHITGIVKWSSFLLRLSRTKLNFLIFYILVFNGPIFTFKFHVVIMTATALVMAEGRKTDKIFLGCKDLSLGVN